MDEARNNGHERDHEHEQIQRLKKVHLEKDEFTQHKVIENALIAFVVEARQLEDHYQGHRKRMIQTVALALADELDRIGKSELMCHISEELMKVLKQAGIRWNAIYLRRCLDERYKNPVNRLNALARQRHPGVPQDTGKSAEELEEQLNRRAVVGKYAIKYTIKIQSNKPIKPIIVGRSVDSYVSMIPVIIKVNAAKQDAEAEFDMGRYKMIESGKEDNPVKQKVPTIV